jgi:hemerythrin-like domain-containing protein
MEYSKPSQILVEEHEVISSVLDAVEAVLGRGGDEFPQEFFEKAFDFFPIFADKCHHAKEEAHLFPMLEARGVPREEGPIGCMLKEHDRARAHVAAVRRALQLTAQGNREARETVRREASAYVALLREHINKENTVLFPAGDYHLTAEDQEALVKAFQSAEDGVLPPGTHERYVALAAELRIMAGLEQQGVIK